MEGNGKEAGPVPPSTEPVSPIPASDPPQPPTSSLSSAIASHNSPPPSGAAGGDGASKPEEGETSGGSGGAREQEETVERRRWSGEGSAARRLSTGASGGGLGAVALPESVVEAVAREAAGAAARAEGPLAAGRTLACIFQVCSTWRAVSRSELLWESLFNVVWPSAVRQAGASWRDEYVRVHSTASNILGGRSTHTVLDYEGFSSIGPSSSNTNSGVACRCLAISNNYLAGGFFDGTVRIFDLKTKACILSMKSGREDRFGPFSRAIAGIVLEDDKVVFASLDGSVFLGNVSQGRQRSVYVGNVIEDGALISFAGSSRWWVGLYAGSPGRSFRVWNAVSQEIVYSGGDVMNADAMRGWHSFVEQAGQIGRVRISNDLLLVAATRMRLSVYDLESDGLPLVVEQVERNAVAAVDIKGDKLLSASYNGVAQVRRLPTMVEISRVRHAGVGDQMQLFGTLNSRQLFLCISGSINAWDVSSGSHLYSLDEQLGDVYDLVASDACLAACVADSGLHLWDFSP